MYIHHSSNVKIEEAWPLATIKNLIRTGPRVATDLSSDMGDPEAETHRWVVVAPYTSTEPLPPGYTHLQASTGDIIVPSGQTEVLSR